MRDGKLIGENTDGKGFPKSLREARDPAAKSITVFGAGGASRAICVELALAGAASVTVVNSDPRRGEALVRLLGERAQARAAFLPWTSNFAVHAGTDIVVNATSIGLYPDTDATL